MPQVEFYTVSVHQSAVWNCVVNICNALLVAIQNTKLVDSNAHAALLLYLLP